MSIIAALQSALGRENVRVDGIDGHTTDWTRVFGGPAACVATPTSTRDVAAALLACQALEVPVIPQGGNTGLVGGAVPAGTGPPPVILSTSRLTGSVRYDPGSQTITARAGTALARVQRAAADSGRHYGVDLAARDQATIGGTVATNAGGIRVCAYGMTRDQVVGLQFVLADGTVVDDRPRVPKDNTGYPLTGLLCGSEGTLAIITSVQVRTWDPPGPSTVLALPLPDCATATRMAATLRSGPHRLLAAELTDATGWAMAAADVGVSTPFPLSPGQVACLFEIEDGGDADGVPDEIADHDDLVVGTDDVTRRRLWSLREGQSEAWSRRGLVHKLDVSVPVDQLDDLLDELRGAVPKLPGVNEWGFFGHLSEGNLHVEVLGSDEPEATVGTILRAVSRRGGSISAEHGVGRAKAAYLSLRRSAAEIDAMARIKRAWDPGELLNPGVLLP